MPTYRYVCKACGEETEAFQSMSAAPLRKCPSCGKLKLERQIGPGAGFLFKGDGFYITDYRSEGYKKAADAESKGGGEKSTSTSDSAAGGKSQGDAPTKTGSGSTDGSSPGRDSGARGKGTGKGSGKGRSGGAKKR